MKADIANDYIESMRDVPFEWGKTDCCMFVADYVLKLTGVDHAAAYRGKYDDDLEAMRVLRDAGGMEALVSSFLGQVQPPLTAGRGDVVWGDYEEGEACGIMVGHTCAFMAEDGICMKPLSSIKGCWHV